MIICNTLGLPEALVHAVSPRTTPEERRDGAEITVTEIINPPRVKQLRDLHHDELRVDVTQRLHTLWGSAIHAYIEKSPYFMSETTLFGQWEGYNRVWSVKGTLDLIEDGVLWDIKPVRAAAALRGEPKIEWVQQLNLYRRLARENGIHIHEMKVAAYLRDYTPADRYREIGYPEHAMVVFKIPMWSADSTIAWTQWRLTQHELEMPPCSAEERWQKPSQWALKREGMKRAVALYDNEEDAKMQRDLRRAEDKKRRYWVEHRPGESVRCKYYCDWWQWCEFGLKERGVTSGVVEPP